MTNQTFRTRSALTRAAERGLRREQRRQDAGRIASICIFILAVYLLATMIAQVMQ